MLGHATLVGSAASIWRKLRSSLTFPHVRAAAKDAVVLATGTSCRHQIKDGTGGAKAALHPIEFIKRLLAARH